MVQLIRGSVPILKCKSSHYGFSCDISIDNLESQMKSKLLLWISKIDGHFRDMVLLVCSCSNLILAVVGSAIVFDAFFLVCVGQGMGKSTWDKWCDSNKWDFQFILSLFACDLPFSGNSWILIIICQVPNLIRV